MAFATVVACVDAGAIGSITTPPEGRIVFGLKQPERFWGRIPPVRCDLRGEEVLNAAYLNAGDLAAKLTNKRQHCKTHISNRLTVYLWRNGGLYFSDDGKAMYDITYIELATDEHRAAGAVRSTGNDLLKYAAANIGLAQSDLTPLMQKTHVVRHQAQSKYGNTALPWMDRSQSDQTGHELHGHAGGTGGYETFIGFDQQHRRGVVVLCSQQGFVASEPLGWLLLERVPLTKPNAAIALTGLSEIAGVGIKLEFELASRALLITEVVPNSPASKAQSAQPSDRAKD